jgi:hypothetical protein
LQKLAGAIAVTPDRREFHAQGEFEVDLNPLTPYAQGEQGAGLGRMSIDKQYHGGLEAVSQGEMLTVMTGFNGSAGYVAVERVSGSLLDMHGSFALQHYGIMDSGESRLILEVVPDSGTGGLTGLTGSMDIQIESGRHFYHLEFSLPS